MKKKNIIIIILIVLGIISIFGLSYAYFVSNISTENKDNSNTSISTGSAVEAILEIPSKGDDTKIIPGYKTSKEYIVKGKGDSNSIPTNASLVVSPILGEFSKYVYWKLYKSDEEITCTRDLDTSSLEIKYISNCTIPDNATLVLSGNSDTTHINITVNYNTNDKYYLVTEYLDNNEDQSNLMDKSFSIDVSLEKVSNTIQDKIIASLDTTGKCPTVNDDGSVNVTASESENSLLCSAPDAYGTSYYFRGNVTNNYVKFGKWSSNGQPKVYGYNSEDSNLYIEYDSLEACQNASSYNQKCTEVNNTDKDIYWRILRINGDGSIRLIYDGTSAHANGESSIDRQVGTSAFNESYNDNAYVGYMYGTPGSSTYVDTHANINDSTIQKYIDTWYENNLKNTDYEKYLADNIFWADRSFHVNNDGGGYGTVTTIYGITDSYDVSKIKLIPTQLNDAFTVNNSNIGNGKLKYVIGLISTEEAIFAGGWKKSLSNYYLYTGQTYWTLSPYMYLNSDGASVLDVDSSGRVDWCNSTREKIIGVKPVINLKPNSLSKGLGTMESPYMVE